MKKLPKKKRRLGIGVSIFILALLATLIYVFIEGSKQIPLSPPIPIVGAANNAATSLLVFIGISFFLFLVTMAVLYYFLTH